MFEQHLQVLCCCFDGVVMSMCMFVCVVMARCSPPTAPLHALWWYAGKCRNSLCVMHMRHRFVGFLKAPSSALAAAKRVLVRFTC
jgi:hypothetical protein